MMTRMMKTAKVVVISDCDLAYEGSTCYLSGAKNAM